MDELIPLHKKILELEQNERLFKETEESGKIGGWQFDPTTLEQTWTDEIFRILEIDLEHGAPEVPKGLEFIDPEFRPLAEKAVQQAMEYGEAYNQEWIVTTDKGNKRWVNAVCNPRMENGKVIAISGSFQDITSKKTLEEELKRSEESFRAILDNNPFPIAVVDEKDQNIRYWSQSAIQLFGHHPKTSDEWYQLAYPNTIYRQQVVERWKPFLKIAQDSKKAVNTGEYEVHCKNGSIKICEIYAQFIPGNLIVTLNDITERKNSEEHFKALNQQLLENEQQHRVANQQLMANEQQLKLANKNILEEKEKAEESKANVTAIIEGTDNSIWAFDRNYQILYINHVFQQEFLQSFSVLLEPGMSLIKALPETLQPFWTPRYDRVLANEQFTIEDAVPTDIGTIYIQISFNPIVKDGQVMGGSCFGSNITSHKLAEIELIKAKEKAEESEEKFKLLNRLTSEMLLLHDIESIYKFIAENLHKLYPNTFILCASIDESTQLSRLEVISNVENSLLKKVIKISGYNPIGKTYKLTDIHNKYFKSGNFIEFDGGLAEFSTSEFPTFAASAIEKLIGLHKIYTIGINKDDGLLAAIHFFTFNKQLITDGSFIEVFVKQAGLILQKKIDERALKVAKEKAESANIHKNYFLANMSHEIRTPMNGVVGFTNLLLDEDFSAEESRKFLHIIERNSLQLLSLIDDIIDVAKIESNELTISKRGCKISDMLFDLEENFNQIKLKLKKEQVKLKLEIPSKHQDLVIMTDGHRLRQVISNLLNNAFKFSEKGTITFGYKVEKSFVKFYVSDQGIGIPQEKLSEIFERFKQLNYKNAAKYGGTGLGLAISRGIIKMLGGSISVKSEPKTGSPFSFNLPFNESKKA